MLFNAGLAVGSLFVLRTRLLAGLRLWPRFVARLRISVGLLILRLLPLLLELRLLPLLLLGLWLLVLLLLELRATLVVVICAAVVVEAVLRTCAAALIAMKGHRTGRRHGLRMPAVVSDIRGAIGTRGLEVLLLNGGGSHVLLMHCGSLFGRRIVADAAGAAAVGNMPVVHDGIVLDHCPVDVGVVDIDIVHVDNGGVVDKVMSTPDAANKTNPHVTEAVVHAAVIANVGTPITGMEDIYATGKAPVRRCPQCACIRRRYP